MSMKSTSFWIAVSTLGDDGRKTAQRSSAYDRYSRSKGLLRGFMDGPHVVGRSQAVDGLISKSRGGSAALGMRGVVPAPNGKKAANLRNAESIAAGDVGAGNGHAAVQDIYAKADQARYSVGLYRRTGITPAVAAGRAYLNNGAAAKAAAGHTPPSAAPVASNGAPMSDGTTNAYQRLDPRSGRQITVKEYRTPKK